MTANLDLQRRLNEITRRSEELSAISSNLSEMVLQLGRLREIANLTKSQSPRGVKDTILQFKSFDT